MKRKLFLFFNNKKLGAFGNNKEKEPQKPHPKLYLQSYILTKLYIYKEYLLCLQSNASGSFLQKCINFVEHRLKFSEFEGTIIPSIRDVKKFLVISVVSNK